MKALRRLAIALALSGGTLIGSAQANLKCQVRPTSLAAMRNCYRALLVFSPTASDPRLRRQGSILDADADDMMDRFVMLTPILPGRNGYQPPLDAPYVMLSAAEMKAMRQRFHIPANRFSVFLLGEDGTVALRSEQPVDAARLNALIDSMPMRKIEQERPHAN
jgi:Domain of unknown function (DUF4174)